MEKLLMCRICLVQNVCMHVVKNRHLQEIYEKMTNILFITEDHRPILACFICYARMKQSYQLLKKCLQAEEVFSQMLNEGFEQKQDKIQGDFFVGYTTTPAEHISIVDVSQSEENYICNKTDIKLEEHSDGAHVAKKPKLDLKQDEKKEETFTNISTEEKKNVEAKMKDIGKSVKPESVTKINEHIENNTVPEFNVNNSIINSENISTESNASESNINNDNLKDCHAVNTAVVTNLCNYIEKDDNKYKKCNNKGIDNDDINRHSSTHINLVTKEKPHTCDKCKRSFTRKHCLKLHIRTHTGENPYKCDICQSSFRRKGYLDRHIRKHTGEKPYKCEICEKSFIDSSGLSSHIRIHTGKKPYKCFICQSNFNQKEHLKRHSQTHTGEKLYKCDLCQKSFNQNCNLTIHIRTHTGEKPYKCDICHRSFTLKSNLNSHIRVHTGEKPYKCDLCQKSFIQKSNLKNHSRIHTGEK